MSLIYLNEAFFIYQVLCLIFIVSNFCICFKVLLSETKFNVLRFNQYVNSILADHCSHCRYINDCIFVSILIITQAQKTFSDDYQFYHYEMKYSMLVIQSQLRKVVQQIATINSKWLVNLHEPNRTANPQSSTMRYVFGRMIYMNVRIQNVRQ